MVSLRNEVFPEPSDLRRWRWEFVENPAGTGYVRLAWAGDTLAGHYAVIPYHIRTSQGTVKGSQSVDTFTRADYRGQGIFVGLAEEVYQAATAQGVSVVFGFPNQQSAHGLIQRLHFAAPFSLYHYVRPLRLGSIPVPIIGSRFGVTSRAIGAMPSDWAELQRSFESQHKLMIERSVNYMNWRFLECPDRQYELVEFRERKRLIGVVVLRQVGRTGQFIDALVADPVYWPTLIASGLRHFRRAGAETAVAYLQPKGPVTANFRRHLFIRRGQPSPFCIRTLIASQHAQWSEPGDWYLMAGDTDYF